MIPLVGNSYSSNLSNSGEQEKEMPEGLEPVANIAQKQLPPKNPESVLDASRLKKIEDSQKLHGRSGKWKHFCEEL